MTLLTIPPAPSSLPLATLGPIEPTVTDIEHKGYMIAIKDAVYMGLVPSFKVPASFIEERLKHYTDIEIAKAMAAMDWARSMALRTYTKAYADMYADNLMPVAPKVEAPQVTLYDRLWPYAQRMAWGLYGAIFVLSLVLITGTHGG